MIGYKNSRLHGKEKERNRDVFKKFIFALILIFQFLFLAPFIVPGEGELRPCSVSGSGMKY
jgi:hypothetical protein